MDADSESTAIGYPVVNNTDYPRELEELAARWIVLSEEEDEIDGSRHLERWEAARLMYALSGRGVLIDPRI